MIVGQFAGAIRILRRCITAAHMSAPDGFDDNFHAGLFMDVQLNLGKCFETMCRYEDGRATYMTGFTIYKL